MIRIRSSNKSYTNYSGSQTDKKNLTITYLCTKSCSDCFKPCLCCVTSTIISKQCLSLILHYFSNEALHRTFYKILNAALNFVLIFYFYSLPLMCSLLTLKNAFMIFYIYTSNLCSLTENLKFKNGFVTFSRIFCCNAALRTTRGSPSVRPSLLAFLPFTQKIFRQPIPQNL